MRDDKRMAIFAALLALAVATAQGCGDLPPGGSAIESVDDGTQSNTSAIVLETCTASSPIVINSGQGFSGSSLCFDNSVATTFLDLGPAGFPTQSIFAAQGVYMYDVNDALVFTNCPGSTAVVNVYAGLPIRYLATASSRTGRCHF